MARTLLLGLAAAAIPFLSAAAAPATPEEAARLTSLFERYVGHPAPGEPGSVTVAPKGEAYAVTLDLKRAAAGLGGFGVTLDPFLATTILTPLPDGTWKVQSADGPPLVMHVGPQTLSFASASSTFDGVYDPKLHAFASLKQDQKGYTYAQTTPTLVQNRRVDAIGMTGTGTPAAGGTAATALHYTFAGTAGDVAFKPAPPPEATAGGNPAVPPPMRPGTTLSYTAPTGALDVSLDRFRTDKLLDLWAFVVAHPTRDGLAAAQDEFKAALRAGMPFADAVKESATLEKVAVATPIGTVSMASLGGGIDASGLAGTGRVSAALSIADLVVPPGQLPPWSAGLVPKVLDLHVALDGIHAAEAGIEAVNDLDLKKDVIITPEQKDRVRELFWPLGGTMTLAPSRIATAALDLRMEGQATIGATATGRVTVTGTGLDKEIAALQAQAATDPGAGQVLGPLVLAKNLSKPNPDGSLVWVVEFGNGPVKVNGATLQ